MKRRTTLTAAFIALAAATGFALTGVAPATAAATSSSVCPGASATITQAQFSALESSPSCDLTGTQIQLADGQTVTVPPAGTGVGGASVTTTGNDSDTSIFQDAQNRVTLRVGDSKIGAKIAIPTNQRMASPTSPDSSAAASTAATTTRCTTTAASKYVLEGQFWVGTYNWWYNDTHSEGTSIAVIESAMTTWLNGTNSCGLATGTGVNATYTTGGTTAGYTPAVNSTGSCPSSGHGHSTVGWGAMSDATLIAKTCYFYNALGYFTEADVKLNTNFTFYLGASASGCSGTRYDLKYTMTHEFGHALGLAHSPESYDQTMMPTQGYCSTAERSLGRGDLAGIRAIYNS